MENGGRKGKATRPHGAPIGVWGAWAGRIRTAPQPQADAPRVALFRAFPLFREGQARPRAALDKIKCRAVPIRRARTRTALG